MLAPYTILACCGLALGTLYALRARATRLESLRRVVTPPEELLLLRQGLRLAKPVMREAGPGEAEELIRRPEQVTIFRPGPAMLSATRPVVDALTERQPVAAMPAVYTFHGDSALLGSYTLDVPTPEDEIQPETVDEPCAPEFARVEVSQADLPADEATAAQGIDAGAPAEEQPVEIPGHPVIGLPEAQETSVRAPHTFDAPPVLEDAVEPIIFHLLEPETAPVAAPEQEPTGESIEYESASLPLAAMTLEVREPETRADEDEAPQDAAPPADAALKPLEWNRTGVDYRDPMPWPKVRGPVIDFHCHLFASRHAKVWFEAAAHYGIDCFVSMTPLEEVAGLLRDWPGRLHFIAVPQWYYEGPDFISDFLRRIEMFYNLGSRIVKFHVAPQTIARRGPLDSPMYEPVFREIEARGMMVMTHVGDPETWYAAKYTEAAKYGRRDAHYAMWERVMQAHPNLPWVGAHLGGNPEDLQRLQSLLDRYPNLNLDCSATRWIAREISKRRDEAREFFIKNADRILFGSDQVSGDERGFDFLSSRWWVHRKLWDTAFIGSNPILDPDLPAGEQQELRGLALPDEVLQKLYHDNAVRVLSRVGVQFGQGI